MIALLLGLGSAMLVASCGGDSDTPGLPAAEAEKLLAELEAIQENFDAQECTVASLDAEDLVARVQDLPDSVDADLRRALENGSEKLSLLLSDPANCEEQTTTVETTEETIEETTEPTETTETTEPTETTETTTEPPPPPPGDGSGGTGL